MIEAETNPYVHRIRTSIYARGRETISRVTVELKNRSDYALVRNKEGVILTLAAAKKTSANSSLLQLLSEAGGLSAQAGPKCYIFRLGAPKIEINLRDLMVNGNPALNIPIYPGDVVNVPPDAKLVVYVLGAVRNPGAISISTSMPVTLLSAIAAAGGPTESAKQSDIKIKRKSARSEEDIIKANLKDILKGKVEDIPLFEGDIITVPESFF